MRVHRIDVGTLASPVRRADGTMIVQAKLARTGVQVYANADGSPRREYRPAANVADQASIDSFKLVPFTNNHPPEMITADNARQYAVGAVGQDVHMDGSWLVGTIAIHDAATIKDLESGKDQISNGYDCDLLMQPGVSPDGERYDAIQTNITGNHVALVWNARAGHEAAIRMDAAAAIDERATAMADAELKKACEARKFHYDAADERGTALAVLAKLGHPANEITANGQKLHQRCDDYLIARAVFAADQILYVADRFATLPKDEHFDEHREDEVHFDEYDPRLGGEFRGQLIGKFDAAYDAAHEQMITQLQTAWVDEWVDTQMPPKPADGDVVGALAYAEQRKQMKADTMQQVTGARDLIRHSQATSEKAMRDAVAAKKVDAAPSGKDAAYAAMIEHNRNAWKGGSK